MKKFIITLFLFLLGVMPSYAVENQAEIFNAKGVVINIIDEIEDKNLQENFEEKQTIQIVNIKVTSGKLKDKIYTTEHHLTSHPAYDIELKPGLKVILDIEKTNGFYDVNVADIDRSGTIFTIIGLFFLLLLFVGGYRGVNSLVSILITAFLVFFVLIPSVLKGFNPVLMAVLVSILSTLATMFIVGGINTKSICASVGTILSLLAAGILSGITINLASLSGFNGQESIILWSSMPELNFKGLLTAAMIIAALGAVMDVGMSIASCLNELKINKPEIKFKRLFKSGMNVGKDMIGTMSNTLILAYLGSAFPLLLLAANAPLIKFINLNSVTSEICSAIIGSIGIVLCVPITAFITAKFLSK